MDWSTLLQEVYGRQGKEGSLERLWRLDLGTPRSPLSSSTITCAGDKLGAREMGLALDWFMIQCVACWSQSSVSAIERNLHARRGRQQNLEIKSTISQLEFLPRSSVAHYLQVLAVLKGIASCSLLTTHVWWLEEICCLQKQSVQGCKS